MEESNNTSLQQLNNASQRIVMRSLRGIRNKGRDAVGAEFKMSSSIKRNAKGNPNVTYMYPNTNTYEWVSRKEQTPLRWKNSGNLSHIQTVQPKASKVLGMNKKQEESAAVDEIRTEADNIRVIYKESSSEKCKDSNRIESALMISAIFDKVFGNPNKMFGSKKTPSLDKAKEALAAIKYIKYNCIIDKKNPQYTAIMQSGGSRKKKSSMRNYRNKNTRRHRKSRKN